MTTEPQLYYLHVHLTIDDRCYWWAGFNGPFLSLACNAMEALHVTKQEGESLVQLMYGVGMPVASHVLIPCSNEVLTPAMRKTLNLA